MPEQVLKKSHFANIDGRVRCLTPDCWGDLLMMPTGRQDTEGIPEFLPYTACPLCMTSFEIEQDMSDRDLYLKVSWMRANPDRADDELPKPPEAAA